MAQRTYASQIWPNGPKEKAITEEGKYPPTESDETNSITVQIAKRPSQAQASPDV